MKNSPQSPITEVELHPASYRHLANGHPWIIKDNYTEKFRAKDRLLWTTDKKTGKQFTLLNDTAHPKIKARFWCSGHIDHEQFSIDLQNRLINAFNKRQELFEQREDIYLSIGEADRLSGLMILKLGDGILIQSYSKIWKKFQKEIVPMIRDNICVDLQLDVTWIAWQDRETEAQSKMFPLWGKLPDQMTIREFDTQYLIKLNQGHDLGIYPDMASIRKRFAHQLEGKRVLNLYSYTGAWSLYPYSRGASSVTSIDLSAKYMDWLKENIKINDYDMNDFHFMVGDVVQSLTELVEAKEKFDFILCDPPSFSSDGKKTTTSLKNYERLFPFFGRLLNEEGQALLFINTHSVSKQKFEVTMNGYAQKARVKKVKSVTPSEDIRSLEAFPEGDYLKGILYQKGGVIKPQPKKSRVSAQKKGKRK